MRVKKIFPYLLIVFSLIGLLASSILMNDTVKLAEDPGVVLPCNINPLLSCTSVTTKWQSHVFGFPNPILGIISFSMLFILGIALLYKVIPEIKEDEPMPRNRKYFWTLVNYGVSFSMLFVMWFFYQSVWKISSLCIYCMTVWAVTWPIFLYTTVWNIKSGHLSLKKIHPKMDSLLLNNHIQILITWYILITLSILFHFRDFFFQ